MRRVQIKVIQYGYVSVDDDADDSEIVRDLETMDLDQLRNYLDDDFDVEVV